MSAHVLLNLLNKLRKRDKMRGLLSILSLFRSAFNKFNNNRSMDVRFYLSYDNVRVCHMRDVKSIVS